MIPDLILIVCVNQKSKMTANSGQIYKLFLYETFESKLEWSIKTVCFCVNRKSEMATVTGHSFNIGNEKNIFTQKLEI